MKIFPVILLVILQISCSKSRDQTSPSNPPPSTSPTQQDQEQDDEKERQDKVESPIDRSESIGNDLVAKLKSPIAEMVSDLTEKKSVPILIEAYGRSLNQFKNLENEISSIAVGSTFQRYISQSSNGETFGMFFIVSNSLEKVDRLINFINSRSPDNKVLVIPGKNALLRSHLQITYRQSNIVKEKKIYETFWIGDSPIFDIKERASEINDITQRLPYLKDCSNLTPECFSSLKKQNYFKQLAVIDGKPQDPLKYLALKLGESNELANQNGYGQSILSSRPVNIFKPLIEDIQIINTLWMLSSDLSYFPELVRFKDPLGTSVVDRYGGIGIYELPLKFYVKIPAATSDAKLNIILATRQLHDYLCSVGPCLEKDGTAVGR